MNKVIGHFRVITRHRHAVIRNCRRAGILWQGLRHDLSKYSPSEFIPGARYFVGTRSPNELEREAKGYSAAWLHHKGRNKHHFEYWSDYIPVERRVGPVKMPLRYVIEMVCDRMAASKIYLGDAYTDSSALDYFVRGKSHRAIHPETSALCEKLLTMVADEGEDKAFAYMRKLIKENKEY